MKMSSPVKASFKCLSLLLLSLTYLSWSTSAFCAGHNFSKAMDHFQIDTSPKNDTRDIENSAQQNVLENNVGTVNSVHQKPAHCGEMSEAQERPASFDHETDHNCCDDLANQCDNISPTLSTPNTIQKADLQWAAVSTKTFVPLVQPVFCAETVQPISTQNVYSPPLHILHCSFLL